MRKPFKAYKILIIAIVIILSIIRLSKEDTLYPTGDAVEYTIMTEAFYNHFSPDVRSSDFDSFKKAYCKINNWQENQKGAYYDEVQRYIARPNKNKLDFDYAFFTDKDGKEYSCHFFFYSLINLPSKILCSIIGFNPLFIHQLTNLILLIATCILLFKYSPFDEIKTSLFVLFFFYSSNYWYLSWQHPEVFTVCFSTLGLWLFLSRKYYWGLFLISIAALQNQPIAVIVMGLSLFVLFTNGLKFKNILKIGLSTFIVLLPSVFYYYHFGTTNLIKYQGALSFNYVTINRVAGLFFDINQGAILVIPLILIVYIILLAKKIIAIRKEKVLLDLIIIISLVGAVCTAATINNWNHGQSVINRYVTYISGLILVHFFYLLMALKNEFIKKIIISFSLLTQMATVYYHASLTKYDWDTNTPKPISNWFFENYPRLYSPDNVIFISRYYPESFNISNSPFCYIKKDGTITKMLIHKEYINNLEIFGINKRHIDSISGTLKYNSDWAYIDINDKLIAIMSPIKLKQYIQKNEVRNKIKEIKLNPEWFEKIKMQAAEKNISIEQSLEENAAFVLNIDLSFAFENNTKENLIKEYISKIKANPEWTESIDKKTKEKNISLDSAIFLDAKWVVENETLK